MLPNITLFARWNPTFDAKAWGGKELTEAEAKLKASRAVGNENNGAGKSASGTLGMSASGRLVMGASRPTQESRLRLLEASVAPNTRHGPAPSLPPDSTWGVSTRGGQARRSRIMEGSRAEVWGQASSFPESGQRAQRWMANTGGSVETPAAGQYRASGGSLQRSMQRSGSEPPYAVDEELAQGPGAGFAWAQYPANQTGRSSGGEFFRSAGGTHSSTQSFSDEMVRRFKAVYAHQASLNRLNEGTRNSAF